MKKDYQNFSKIETLKSVCNYCGKKFERTREYIWDEDIQDYIVTFSFEEILYCDDCIEE